MSEAEQSELNSVRELTQVLVNEIEAQADGCATIAALLDGQTSPVAASIVAMLSMQEKVARSLLTTAKSFGWEPESD